MNQNLKNIYDFSNRKTENNVINRPNSNYLYSNFSYSDLNKNDVMNKKIYYNNLSKNNLFNDVNSNERYDEENIYSKFNKRASTPSVNHHYIKNNNRDLYKEYINYNNFIKYIYK